MFFMFVESRVSAQEFVTDTLHLTVYFHKGKTVIDDGYRSNGQNIREFCYKLSQHLADPLASIDELVINGSASPEGPYATNARLARERAHSIGARIAELKGFDKSVIKYEYIPEDWDGLGRILDTLDQPWAEQAMEILERTPQFETVNGKRTEPRKDSFKEFLDGKPWAWLDKNVFPQLRAAGGGISCVITRPAPVVIRDTVYLKPDTVYVEPPKPDTVFIQQSVPVPVPVPVPAKVNPFEGRKMIFALRTNFIMVPLTNIGVEVPIGEHWSVGADWYSPWIWRENYKFPSLRHSSDTDGRGWAFQFQAADIEARYWFRNEKKHPEQRLLGHSVGLYAAAGHYDFEWKSKGHQGEFWNVGLDYLYAVPVFKGKMHMEFELGVGYIHSMNTPYECLVLGEVCYRLPGERKRVDWFGPTRAQVSLVLPVYVKSRGKKN